MRKISQALFSQIDFAYCTVIRFASPRIDERTPNVASIYLRIHEQLLGAG